MHAARELVGRGDGQIAKRMLNFEVGLVRIRRAEILVDAEDDAVRKIRSGYEAELGDVG